MDAIAELPLKAIPVQQGHEKLEVLLLAIVWRGGHQQEIPGDAGEQLAKPVTLRGLDLAAEERGRHFVSFVADDQIPVGLLELLLKVFVTAQFIEAADDEVVLLEPVARSGRFQLVVRHNLKRQMEPAFHFVLPLLGQIAGADDHAALEIATDVEFLRQQPTHDGFARARIIRQQKAKWLPGEHLLVDRRDLVRKRLDQGGMDGQERIEEVGQPDAVGLGDQAEQSHHRHRKTRDGPP